jgi:hypothetical protein
MPDRRTHRGPHPEDAALFAAAAIPVLRAAAADLTWLLDRGYAVSSSLKLVGDRHHLAARQRVAVARCVCTSAQCAGRTARRIPDDLVTGHAVWLDGYNVLTTVEAALSGAVLLQGADGTLRDMVSMHGNYRKVSETQPALGLIGQTLLERRPFHVRWLLDRPVSNSGRLRQIIEQVASERNWPWTVDLVPDPDPVLAESLAIVATADSAILDRCELWLNLARRVVELYVPNAHIVCLAPTMNASGDGVDRVTG